MRALSWLMVLAAAIAGPSAPAAAKGIVADVDDHLVEISTDFAGQDILVFGAIDGDLHQVIVDVGDDALGGRRSGQAGNRRGKNHQPGERAHHRLPSKGCRENRSSGVATSV